jgi:hypothetical protein
MKSSATLLAFLLFCSTTRTVFQISPVVMTEGYKADVARHLSVRGQDGNVFKTKKPDFAVRPLVLVAHFHLSHFFALA